MNKNIDKEELELGQRIFRSALRVNSALTEISIILHNKGFSWACVREYFQIIVLTLGKNLKKNLIAPL
ncbi:hypothetical protein O185_23305 [Photorhabdus temperata J3]|uniref:Uncharacterized protein n=1 Tax=Photorhabdus temperata J3 TaxID=1389415 RepID=U7QWB2_PHOTE|nr:hypothetical protein O185_23305 [Photorhabdus temperata J3]